MTETRPSPNEVIDRIESLTDNPDDIKAISDAGDDDLYWYYLVVQAREYEGNEYVTEGYVQLVKEDLPPGEEDRDDTFKKNVINRRAENVRDMAYKLEELYGQVSQRLMNEAGGSEYDAPIYMR